VEINALWDAVQFNPAPNLTLITDELSTYKSMKKYCRHERVSHGRRQYARKATDGLNVHVNTCESFFSLLKRGHYGVYHSMSKPHLHRYVAEYAFRWNHRQAKDSERRDAAIKQAPGKRLKYKTAKKTA
jgi:hypothetical protein